MTSILYLDDYGREEELELRANGVRVDRVESCVVLAGKIDEGLDRRQLLRGPRYGADWYLPVIRSLQSAGIATVPDEQSFVVGSDYRRQRAAFGELAPASQVFDRRTSAEAMVESLHRQRMQLPVFVRTDIESLAKYTGTEGTILESWDSSRVRSMVEMMAKYIPRFEFVIFKEMFDVKLSVGDAARMELRTVGLDGKLALIDSDAPSLGFADDLIMKAEEFANLCFGRLKQHGGAGPYFLDIGISTQGRFFVIECKNFANGHIRKVPLVFGRLIEIFASSR